MRAVVIGKEAEPLQLKEVSKPEARSGYAIVRVKAAALNRRDQWIREGKYPGIIEGTTLGSDGSGEVVDGSKDWLGKKVLINPNVNWGDDPRVQSKSYSVLGMPTNGTLAEFVQVPEDRLVECPSHLSPAEAAAVPLAGLTAFRAVFNKGGVKKGTKVLVTGVGGGVAQFALQFCVAAGARVHVTSGSDEKINRAVEAGAVAGINYHNIDESHDEFDVIIDSAGGSLLNTYLKIIGSGGRIVMYGSTTGYPPKMDAFRLFWSQAQIMGTTMGNDEEFALMVDFIAKHQLIPTIDKMYSLEDYINAFDRFNSKDHFGKIVLEMD